MGIIAYTREGRPKAQGQSFAPQSVVMRAVKTTDTTATLSTAATVILFDTKDFDPYNWYDPTTGRWTPKIAGYYRVTGQLNMTAVNANESMTAAVRKNGVMVASESSNTPSAAAGSADKNVSALMYLNGTTDYAEIAAYFGSGTTNKITAAGGADPSFIAAELIASSVGVAPEPWHFVGATGEPAFLNGWTNNSGGYEPTRFYKDPYGQVHVQGHILAPASGMGIAVFVLPVGYRPANAIEGSSVMFTGGSNTIGRFQISATTGEVRVYSTTNTAPPASAQYTLNNIHFRAEQ